MADIVVEITFRTIIPFSDDVDPSEVNELDMLDQLHGETVEEILDEWTIIKVESRRFDK
jgi:hypothetical protein